MHRIVVNVETGDTANVPLSPEEIAELELLQVAATPSPDWLGFSTALMAAPAVNAMLGAVLAATPGLYGGLTVGLNEASKGDTRLFLSAWKAAQQLGLISSQLAVVVQASSFAYNLPVDFSSALLPWLFPVDVSRGYYWTAPDGSRWVFDQPRNIDGTYATDDPATAESESTMRWLFVQ